MKSANPNGTNAQATGTTITATSDVSSLRLLDAEAAASVAANTHWTVWPKTQQGVSGGEGGPA